MEKSNNLFVLFIFSLIVEIDIIIINLINTFFVSRFLGLDGAAAYEVMMPLLAIIGAFSALAYCGIQTVCSKDYCAKDFESFKKHKNAGYTWIILIMIILTILFYFFKLPVLDLLGANDGSETLAVLSDEAYIMIIFCFIPQGIFSITSCLLFFEEKKQLIVINIILYTSMILGSILVTILGPSMMWYMFINIISISLADLYLIFYAFIIKRKTSLASFDKLNFKFKDVKDSLYTGLPDFIEYFAASIFYLIENIYVLSRFSESLIAGMAVFEAIDNIPEILCIGFSFLVTSMLGTRVGRFISIESKENSDIIEKDLENSAKKLTYLATIGGIIFSVILILVAYPTAKAFLPLGDQEAIHYAFLLTTSCAISFVFYLINSQIISYYKIVKAYSFAHIALFVEAFLFPLGFKILFGELFGAIGFCLGTFAGEIFTLLLNFVIVTIVNNRFPTKIKDFGMKKYLYKLKNIKNELITEEQNYD